MKDPVDFQDVMGELTDFQNAIGEIHSGLKNAKNKEILGSVLDSLQKARADVEVEYPKAMNMIDETAQRVRKEAKERLAEMQKQKAAAQKNAEAMQAKMGQPPKRTPKSEIKVDPALGEKLRVELLERFQSSTEDLGSHASKIREAWQDWD